VAIKLLRSGADPARFEREARAVAALADPNVVRVYDYGVAENRPFIVLEHLPGGTLPDLLREGRPSPTTRPPGSRPRSRAAWRMRTPAGSCTAT
jgi:serine/threonine protein kinase